jgi:flagellar motor protein MotB
LAEEKKKPGGDSGGESRWAGVWDQVVGKLVPLVISGASLVGFVAFAGAVIVWTQLDAVEVPPDQAIAAFPRNQLVAIGAALLLLFGFFGVLAVICSYLVDRSGRPTAGVFRGLFLLLIAEGAAAMILVEGLTAQATEVALGIFVLAVGFALWASFVEEFVELRDVLHLGKGETMEPRPRAKALLPLRQITHVSQRFPFVFRSPPLLAALAVVAAIVVLIHVGEDDDVLRWVAAGLGLVFLLWAAIELHVYYGIRTERETEETTQEDEEAEREIEDEEAKKTTEERLANRPLARLARQIPPLRRQEEKRKKEAKEREKERKKEMDEQDRVAKGRPYRFFIERDGAFVMAASLAAGVGLPAWMVHELWLAGSLAAAVVLFFGLWRIAALSKKGFMWFGFAVFFSVPLFGTLTLMARNLDNPLVQPVALIRNTDGPNEAIQGLYVTETSDRVYFANVATEACGHEIEPNSGRLLWVPKSEVVAMSIGPAQGVDSAARSALEMSYALTPSVETPAGGHFSLTPVEKRSEKAEKAKAEEAEAPTSELDRRLENPGPAVRPNFGSGISVDPEIASPGEEVVLRMNEPNSNSEGFGTTRSRRTLRVGGVPADIVKTVTHNPEEAEFIETRDGHVLELAKKEPYVVEEGKYVSREDAVDPTWNKTLYVKLTDKAVTESRGGRVGEEGAYLPLATSGALPVVVGEPALRLKGGPAVDRLASQSPVAVAGQPLLRQAWSEDQIRFRVPEDAESGVVTVECEQLGGQPLLRVSHVPTARIGVRMLAGSGRVTFDSSRSRDEDGEIKSRRWTIDDLSRGHKPKISIGLPPRLGVYSVELTVTDNEGWTDTAKLRLLRLRSSRFAFGNPKPHRKAIEAVHRALLAAVGGKPPAAIELDGHADNPGSTFYNMNLSLERDENVLKMLQSGIKAGKTKAGKTKTGEPQASESSTGDRMTPITAQGVPVEELAYGESCPFDPHPGKRPRNRRVDVFILDQGVTVKQPKGCHPGRVKRDRWYVLP